MATNEELKTSGLAKLTEDEKMALGLIKKPKKPRKNMNLKIHYMIGDANGHTYESQTIPVSNPFLKPLCSILDRLEPIKGHWGVVFNSSRYPNHVEEGHISEIEADLLTLITDYWWVEEDEQPEELESVCKHFGLDPAQVSDHVSDFEGLFKSESVYSFLVFEGYKLK